MGGLRRPTAEEIRERRASLAERARNGTLALPAAVGEMRHTLGLSQEQFARMVRLTRRQLAEIERGEANPTIETLRRIGSVFGLEVGFVVRGSVPRPTKRFSIGSSASADTASVPLDLEDEDLKGPIF